MLPIVASASAIILSSRHELPTSRLTCSLATFTVGEPSRSSHGEGIVHNQDLSDLPQGWLGAIEAVRDVMLENLPEGFEEAMYWG